MATKNGKLRFESYCGYNSVLFDSNNANHQTNAKRLLVMYGGDWICQSIMAMPNVDHLTYTQIMSALEANFRDVTLEPIKWSLLCANLC